MRGDKYVNYNYNVEYRDGIKSEGDKIDMPCTHKCNSQPKRINDTSPILSHQMTTKLHNHHKSSSCVEERNHWGAFTNTLVAWLTLRGGGGLACDIWHTT